MPIVLRVWLAVSVTVLLVLGIGATLRIAEEREHLLDIALRDRQFSGQAVQELLRSQASPEQGLARAIDFVEHHEDTTPHRSARIVSVGADARWPRVELDPPLVERLARGEVVTALRSGRIELFIPVAGADGAVIEHSEPDEARALVTRIGSWAVALQTLALTAIAGLVVFVVLRWLVGRPLGTLARFARRIGNGELDARVEVGTTNDEVSVLALEMNRMAEALAESRRRVDDLEADRTETLEQLRHADRLRTAGQLASELAHELGTPLNVVSGHARLIEQEPDVPEQARQSARIALEQVARMTRTIKDLLGFVRRKSAAPGRHDLVELARSASRMLAPLAKRHRIELAVSAESEHVHAEVDANQILQVLTNLLVNAMQASPSDSAVRVALRVVDATAPEGVHARAGRYASIAVVDQGTGIPSDDVHRLFEAFFTRRPEGEGTGLGLAVVDGIVREHRGWVTVQSVESRGSTFEVHLPIERESASHDRPRSSATTAQPLRTEPRARASS